MSDVLKVLIGFHVGVVMSGLFIGLVSGLPILVSIVMSWSFFGAIFVLVWTVDGDS